MYFVHGKMYFRTDKYQRFSISPFFLKVKNSYYFYEYYCQEKGSLTPDKFFSSILRACQLFTTVSSVLWNFKLLVFVLFVFFEEIPR